MSNYMNCNMTVKNGKSDLEAIQNYIAEHDESNISFAFDHGGSFSVEGDDVCFWGVNMINWGIEISEMKALSEAFPNLLFIFDQDDDYDRERYYFRNGKYAYYQPELVWPEFNPNDLVEVVINAD